jgi:hypothetical protein
MPLPATVRVKLSDESAAYVALTPVVVREMPLAELLEYIAASAGRDPGAVAGSLRRGSLVSGASRFRWEGWEADPEELAAALAALPAPDPTRPFHAEQCVKATLCGPGVRIEIARQAASRRRLLRRPSFWQALLSAAHECVYVTYLPRERADLYRAPLSSEQASALNRAASLLVFRDLAAQIRTARLTEAEFVVARPPEPASPSPSG